MLRISRKGEGSDGQMSRTTSDVSSKLMKFNNTMNSFAKCWRLPSSLSLKGKHSKDEMSTDEFTRNDGMDIIRHKIDGTIFNTNYIDFFIRFEYCLGYCYLHLFYNKNELQNVYCCGMKWEKIVLKSQLERCIVKTFSFLFTWVQLVCLSKTIWMENENQPCSVHYFHLDRIILILI